MPSFRLSLEDFSEVVPEQVRQSDDLGWIDVEVPRALEGLVRPYRVSGADGAAARKPLGVWPVGRGTTLQEAGS